MAIFEKLFQKQIDQAVHSALAISETENNFLIGTRSASESGRDRYTYDRAEILEQSLRGLARESSSPPDRRINLVNML